MAEYIERGKAINAVFEAYADGRSAYIALETVPTADARPVVLCRDCKHWKPSKIEPSLRVCTYVCGATFVRNAEDFCSRGEKREES